MDPTVKVAKKYPEAQVRARHRLQARRQPRHLFGRFYEGRYIQGQIAAKMSKTGMLGYIGSFPIPEVISGINATMLGAQTVNPNIKVKIIWVNSWFDPGKEADAAKALLDQGADVLMQHTDSPAAMQVAAQRGVFAFGQDSDMIKFGPKTQLTAIINNWAPYYIERVQTGARRQVAERRRVGRAQDQDRADGALHQHAGRREEDGDGDRSGDHATASCIRSSARSSRRTASTVECKGGGNLDDGQILGMNFYVKGVDDKIPGK